MAEIEWKAAVGCKGIVMWDVESQSVRQDHKYIGGGRARLRRVLFRFRTPYPSRNQNP